MTRMSFTRLTTVALVALTAAFPATARDAGERSAPETHVFAAPLFAAHASEPGASFRKAPERKGRNCARISCRAIDLR